MKSHRQGSLARWAGAGLVALGLLAGCGGGGGGSAGGDPVVVAPPVPPVTVPVNTAPQVSVQFAGSVTTGVPGIDASATTGADVVLDASGSLDAEGQALTYAWSVVSKPVGSALAIAEAGATKLNVKPDLLGNYVFNLRVTDSKGAFSEKSVTLLADNTPPAAVVIVNATYTAQAVTRPALSVSAGSNIVLDASGSTDADGDKVTTTWELIEKPVGSTAALVISGQTARLSADVLGLYRVRARGADGKGAYAETIYLISAGNKAPIGVIQGAVAVVSRDTQSVPVGQPVVTSGILSFDEGGAKLSYTWAVDSRPTGSVAVLGAATAAVPSFTPDVAGNYVLSLTVNNGRQTAVAYLKLTVFTSTQSVVALPFTPLDVRYDKALDRLIMVAAGPDALKIVNPADGTATSVSLPAPVKSFNLSADGKLAAVLHEGVVSLVDLVAGKLLLSTGTAGTQTEVFVTNDGFVYLTGQSAGSSSQTVIKALNARTGLALASLDYSSGGFYGTMRGIFAASKNKAFVTSTSSSYYSSYFTIDPKTGAVLTSGYSGYGDYSVAAPFFLSPKEDLLFTGNGMYFNTDTMKYVGRFVLSSTSNTMLSMSYSPTQAEAVMMESTYGYSSSLANDLTYFSSYKRYTGELLFPAGDVALPLIGGEVSYGIGIFHTSAGDPVALVQTGGALKSTARAKYYLVYR